MRYAILIALILAPTLRADEPLTLNVWPAAAPGETRTVQEKWANPAKPGEKPIKRVTDVTQPTLTVYRPPADKDTGAAVIVAPGGGYKALMMDYEGEDVARWLVTHGVTGIVLKYRLPAPEGTPRHLPALQDAQRSISLVRSRAAEWKIDSQRIGMLGFSAGAHLSAACSTNFDRRAYPAADDIDKVSCRPDFAVLVYPGLIIEKPPTPGSTLPPGGAPPAGPLSATLSPEIRVTKDAPPAFVVMGHDDRVDSENAVFYYLAMKRAGASAELHVYATGPHGFGIKPSEKPHGTWPDRLTDWMKQQKVVAPR
ncbi:MAG: alpha/beta hydrolase [Phycisphaerae bacterium]|nr:alpha/beta hydrolase [Tepidisphaeraceae bacterium]